MVTGSSALQIRGENGPGSHAVPELGAPRVQQVCGTDASFTSKKMQTVSYAEVFSLDLWICGLQSTQGDAS